MSLRSYSTRTNISLSPRQVLSCLVSHLSKPLVSLCYQSLRPRRHFTCHSSLLRRIAPHGYAAHARLGLNPKTSRFVDAVSPSTRPHFRLSRLLVLVSGLIDFLLFD